MLFGTSGMRGVVGREITPQLCSEVARAAGEVLPLGSKVYLATDTRGSRDRIRAAIVSGLLSSGIDVTDFGILPTLPKRSFETVSPEPCAFIK